MGSTERPSLAARVLGIKEHWEIRQLHSQIRKGARHITDKGRIIASGEGIGVYVMLIDGSDSEIVEETRQLKGRRPDQREATVLPPEERLFGLIDFSLLKELNPEVDEETIASLYRAHPLGLVVPAREDTVPAHLITYLQNGDRNVPTILNVWHPPSDRVFSMLWRAIEEVEGRLGTKRKVILAGTSANLSGQSSPTTIREARQSFPRGVALFIKDPKEGRGLYQGSQTIITLVENPPAVVRKGSVHPEKHPEQFQKFRDILPNLRVPAE